MAEGNGVPHQELRPGAQVATADGVIGTLVGVAEDDSGAQFLQIRSPAGVRTVPLGLVVSASRERITLRGTRAELDSTAARPSGALRPIDVQRLQPDAVDERVLELVEEELVPHVELKQAGTVHIRIEEEEVPGRVEFETTNEEVEVVHEPVGKPVSEKSEPWREGDDLIVPIYRERLVVTRQLVLEEQLRVRRHRVTEKQLIEDRIKRERVVVDPGEADDLVSEKYPLDR
jgi:stress response protein YsnF